MFAKDNMPVLKTNEALQGSRSPELAQHWVSLQNEKSRLFLPCSHRCHQLLFLCYCCSATEYTKEGMQGSSRLRAPFFWKVKGSSSSQVYRYYWGYNVTVSSKQEFLALPLSAASTISTLNTPDYMLSSWLGHVEYHGSPAQLCLKHRT